ncbi:hypothetical protein [Pendulispora albinea]|uniref:DUF4276 family protein n=1 Tax=Pendulispora albinea TaxID=2741071 RepID=A0ABZ2M6M0_9BACT
MSESPRTGKVNVFLGGEGPNELGGRAGDPVYQTGTLPGVVETLLLRVQPDGWNVVGATKWSQIRKLRAKGPTPNEERNVLGLVYEAKRAGAHVAAFVRDADDDKSRPKVIEDAIAKAELAFPEVQVIGGAALPVLEGWILAILGAEGTEKLGKVAAQSKLDERGIARKDTAAMVQVAVDAALDEIPADATSLRKWLGTAANVLPRLVQGAVRRDVQAPENDTPTPRR